ncbi:hypothetical protein ACNR90_003466 [Candidozyma auris]
MRVANRFKLERQTEKSVKQIGGTAATAGGRGRVLLHEEATKQARTATKATKQIPPVSEALPQGWHCLLFNLFSSSGAGANPNPLPASPSTSFSGYASHDPPTPLESDVSLSLPRRFFIFMTALQGVSVSSALGALGGSRLS